MRPRDPEHYTSAASAARILREYANKLERLTSVTVKVDLKIRIHSDSGVTAMDIMTLSHRTNKSQP
jgi:hypothetical protein